MSYFTEPLPQSLDECQDMMLLLMNEIEGIYGQLNDTERRKHYKSDKDYQNWRKSAFNANNFKGYQLDELEAHLKTCFHVEYPTKLSLLVAIQDRQLKPPRWLTDEPIESIPQIELHSLSQHTINEILQRLTSARGKMNQTEVGAVLGVSSSAISAWEKGRSPITLNTIFKLCQLYGVPPMFILTGKPRIDAKDVETIASTLQEGVDMLRSLLE